MVPSCMRPERGSAAVCSVRYRTEWKQCRALRCCKGEISMPCDGIAVLPARTVRTEVVRELSTAVGRKALRAYLEETGLAVEAVEAGRDGLTVRLRGGACFALRQGRGGTCIVGYGVDGLGSDFLSRRLAGCERVAGLLVQQCVLAVLQKVVRADRVSRAPGGAVVVEARIQGGWA